MSHNEGENGDDGDCGSGDVDESDDVDDYENSGGDIEMEEEDQEKYGR